MNRLFKLLIASSALAVTLMLSGGALAQPPKDTKSKTTAKPAAAPVATDKDIADATAKGLVWVNTSTKVYHKDGQFYGKTKQGKFMTEADAQKAGFRAAQDSAAGKKKKTAPSKK